MRKIIVITALLAALSAGTVSASVLGCTSPNATNYNPLADVDDGSCTIMSMSGHFMKPLINPFVPATVSAAGNLVTVSWLSTQFMDGWVMVTPAPLGMVLDPYQHYSGILGASAETFEANYGTYHTATFTLAAGTYYVRPVSAIGNYVVYGTEQTVVVE